MKSGLTDTANAAFPKNDNRQDCLFKAERELPCGSIVSERNGPHHRQDQPYAGSFGMSMKLAVQFNKKAKVVKTENDIKVGMRTESDGTKIAVRGGKVISRYHAPKTETKDMDGRPATQAVKLNQFRQAASEAVARKHKAARFHRAPSSAPTP